MNEIHLAAVHYIYLPLINEKLKVWSRAWSRHGMRTTRSSPICMWVSGQLQNPLGIELVGSTIDNYGKEVVIDTESEDGSEGWPIFSSLSLLLSVECKSVLARHLPSTLLSANSGVEHYLKSV